MGTVFGKVDLLRSAALELAGSGHEVLVATGPDIDPGALGDVPALVHVEQEVPQARLLPYVDLVVHHGGTGTVIGSLASGLPQIITPQGADQFWNADHLAADAIDPGGAPGDTMRQAPSAAR